ncbi:MAG: NAD(P)H-quinone oxidoreductase [Deltaproteobacteria bacterium]|nr:MAG: NAD(P)H-quinone oxidoreductase [Deltaproteobacteria bacterium]
MARYEAVVIEAPGGPEVLSIDTVEVRDPGYGEVRVEVAAAGLNRADLLQRMGRYPAPPGVPPNVPGLEFAGVVETVGPGVREWKAGDRVMGIVGGGAMARAVTVHARELVPVPAGLSLVDAAAIPEAFMTAWDAVVRQGALVSGEWVLIHAAASGVGTAAVQIVRRMGARSIATTRTPAKTGKLKHLGADRVVVSKEGFVQPVREIAPEGVDLILDLVGGDAVADNLELIRTTGRYVLVGLLGGRQASLDLGVVLRRRVRLFGTVLRARPLEEKIALAQDFARQVLPGFDEGTLEPVVELVLPMVQVAEAHETMARGAHVGKIVLAW